MRSGTGSGTAGLVWIVGDHLGSTAFTVDATGLKQSERRYKPWGEARYTEGETGTKYGFTGQRADGYITDGLAGQGSGLYQMGARWYDPALGRFISPDSIVPGEGESGNPNAVGYLDSETYSPLIVDYNETQFLEQLNSENRERQQDTNWKFPAVPTNPIVFDRYAYSLNNPVRYVDPSGHFAFLAALALIGPVGWAAIGVTAVGVAVYLAVPGVRPAVTNAISQAGQSLSNSLSELARPRNNQAQNDQFKGAVKKLEEILGRKLSEKEVEQLHRACHDLEDPGFWDIVEQGLKEFPQDEEEEE